MSNEPATLCAYYFSQEEIQRHQAEHVIHVSRPADGGGVEWEFRIEWSVLLGRPAVRVMLYDDAWRAFVEIPGFFRWLASQHDRAPGLSFLVDALRAVVGEAGALDVRGYWPEGCGVEGEKRPEPPPRPPEHAPAYDRVARWYEAGCPLDRDWATANIQTEGLPGAYLRAGLPGWEG
jgi:hypothetical protein